MTHTEIVQFFRDNGLNPKTVDITTDGDAKILDIWVSFEDDGDFEFVPLNEIPGMSEN